MTEQHEPKEEQTVSEATAETATDVEEETAGADVVPIHGDVERATGHMAVGGVNVDRDLLSRTLGKDLTDDELDLFVAVCNRTGLDPFAKQIYAIVRGKDAKRKMGIQTSIDGFRLIAERSGRYSGQEPIMWCGPDKVWTDVWLEDVDPVAARAGVYKAGFAEVLRRVATWDQYVQTDYNGKTTPMWTKMPALMLGKCAEALALRAAFPAELSGLYTDDEMSQAESTFAGARNGGAISATSVDGDAVIDADVIVDTFLRVAALPDDLREELRTTWANVDKLKGLPLRVLPVRLLGLVQSLLRGVETKAEKVDGWVAQEQYEIQRRTLGRGVVAALAAAVRQPVAVTDDQDVPAASGDVETSDAAGEPSEALSGDDSPSDETVEKRHARARQVAAEAGLTPASTLLGQTDVDVVQVDEGHLYPLAAPPKIDPGDQSVAERLSVAQVDVVIEYVRQLDVTTLNKALRAHDVKVAGTGEDVRRRHLSLAILREIERNAETGE